MIPINSVYEMGRITKPHGIKGEVSIHIKDDVFDRVDADYLVLEVEGILVPFFIEEYRFRSDEVVIMKFCDIDSIDRARQLVGVRVFFPRHLADSTDDRPLSWAEVIGFRLVDAATGSDIGTILSVDDSTSNILFEVTPASSDSRTQPSPAPPLLIPAALPLITAVSPNDRSITMSIPDGLLTLNP